MVCPTGKVKRQVKAYSRCQKAAPPKRKINKRGGRTGRVAKKVAKAAAKKGAKGSSATRMKGAAVARALTKRRAGVAPPRKKVKIVRKKK